MRRNSAIWFSKKDFPAIHLLTKRRGFSRVKLRRAGGPFINGTMRSSNGSCGANGCGNGCRSSDCPPSEKRGGGGGGSSFATGHSAQTRLRRGLFYPSSSRGCHGSNSRL